jgi:glucose/arabinose dehydrogenase
VKPFVRASIRAAAVAAASCASARAQTLPPDFVAEPVAGGWNEPTCVCFAGADDLLVAEKAGLLWDVRRGFKHVKPVIDLQQEIMNNGDRGLLSVAVDPQWDVNGFVYLLYVVDPNEDGNDWEQETFGRLTRYTTSIDVNGDLVADPASRAILIGATWSEGFPSLHFSHAVGDLRFAADGSLLISNGDGAHWDLTDFGGYDPNGFGDGKFDASEDIGAFRSQSLTSLSGKVLRVDPATGLGLPDNPFFTGDPADHASRVWISGLRNPFRFCLDPGSGSPERLYISDVGWFNWEEVDRGTSGLNLGWPCWEASVICKSYYNNNPFGQCHDASLFTKPILNWNHTDPKNIGYIGNCATGVCVYTGTEYPSKYRGRLFYCDYGQSWIRSVSFVGGAPAQPELFASGANAPVDLVADPSNGDLYFISMATNAVQHLRYTKTNHPPVAVVTVVPPWGTLPFAVALDASASYDPEGGPLTFDWDLGDGSHSTQASLSKSYPNPQNYLVSLTVTDAGGESTKFAQSVTVGGRGGPPPPTVVSIDSPPAGSTFVPGVTLLSLDATVADAEDDAAGIPLSVRWVVDLVHDHHVHPSWATLTGAHATYTPPVHGEGVYLHVTLVVTDSRGLATTQAFDLFDSTATPEPHLVALSNFAPRLGRAIEATGHVHWAGLGETDLAFDWGDGTVDRFRASHMQDCKPSHLYAGPGTYSLRLVAGSGDTAGTVVQPVFVRPLAPAVAIYAPLVAPHYLPIDARWDLATRLADDVHAAGFEAQIFGASDQPALAAWMDDYRSDGVRDWLVCLDEGAGLVYHGQDETSPAERWLAAGNAIAWTGCAPFSLWLTVDGDEFDHGAGPYALDELLDAAAPQLASGAGAMALAPDAADLPALAPFSTNLGVVTARLAPDWSVAKLYASDGGDPPISDALVLRHAAGGEYAQFLCVDDATLPREEVLRDFFASHVHSGLPGGPPPCTLVHPAPHAEASRRPTLAWNAAPDASSWLVEVATDATFAEPVFTATVLRGDSLAIRRESVRVDPALESGRHYRWRVTARNDFGTATSATRGFRVE